MKKFFKNVKSVVKTINAVYCFVSAVVTVIGFIIFLKQSTNKQKSNIDCISGEYIEEDLETDLEQFLFKRRNKNEIE